MRPTNFGEMAGQDINKRILTAILKNPENAPKSLVFEGERGTGKTTSSRIFARALNCLNLSSNMQPCNECDNCKQSIDFCDYYYEYDSCIVGNVDTMKSLRDTFSISNGANWKIITFDEIHLASKQAQSALLKEIEDVATKVFYVFCTTDPQKLLDTILSRSLVLRYDKISQLDMESNLRYVANHRNILLDDESLKLIIKRSGGHMREAHNLLDVFNLVGSSDFKNFAKVADAVIKKLFISILNSKDDFFNNLQTLLSFPITHLKFDFQNTILELTAVAVGKNVGDELSQQVISLWGAGWLKLVKTFLSEWVQKSFESDLTLQIMFLSLYQLVNQNNTKTVQTSSASASTSTSNYQNLMARAAKS